MKKSLLRYLALFVFASAIVLITTAEEGMFPLNDLKKLPFPALKKMGLQLTSEQIYSETKPSIKDAIILLGGGTAEFVSPNGLILTNHHVAFGALQANSTPEHDYITNGYIAETNEKELQTSYTAQILESITDVSSEVFSAVKADMSLEEKESAIRNKSSEIEKQYSKDDLSANVAAMNGGIEYHLYIYKKLSDVRLVYAPPRSIGEYGGEIDNWMWPRHTGDFAFFRAYVDKNGKGAKYSAENVPFKPKHFLKFSTAPLKEGDFTFIMGFPGTTMRYQTSYEIGYASDIRYTYMNKFFKAMIESMEEMGKDDLATSIKYASTVKGYANVMKKYQGMIDGINKYKFLDSKVLLENDFRNAMAKNANLEKKYGKVLDKIKALYDENRSFGIKQTSLASAANFCRSLSYALITAGWITEKNKKDDERAAGFKEREFQVMKMRWNMMKSSFEPELDKVYLEKFMMILASLPEKDKISAVEEIAKGKTRLEKENAVKAWVNEVFEKSNFTSHDKAMKMSDLSLDSLKSLKDPLADFALKLVEEYKSLGTKVSANNLQMTELRREWIRGLMEWKGTYFYPDANRTIRFTYGTVKGYNPRDAVSYKFITTLSGVVEKESGEEPFKNEKKLLELHNKKDYGKYLDKTIGDVPACFLSTTDITGGNSGSPILDGKGNLIGCAFDGDYESMTSDYLFDPKLTRTINVDSRYILFILDKFSNAQTLLSEIQTTK